MGDLQETTLTISDPSLTEVLAQFGRVLAKVEQLLSAQAPATDDALDDAVAFIWQRNGFHPVRHIDPIRLSDLVGIEKQLSVLLRNTRQFLRGAPSNHVLLWGERGSGKSSAVKAILNEFAPEGLRLVQIHRHNLLDLPEIIDRLWDRPEKYLLFCDDLSFAAGDTEYNELKALLEGGIHARPANMLVYATSNRRHLLPERLSDRQMIADGEEMHPDEALGELLSLADRFGLRLGFYKIDQPTYLRIVSHLAEMRGLRVEAAVLEREALRWSLTAAGRSGRSARQFIDDYAGREA